MSLQSPANMQELMSLIGYLLLHWGWLENRLQDGRVPEGLADVRRLRNVICHGLQEAHADGIEAYVLCRRLDGTMERISGVELYGAVHELEQAAARPRSS